MREGRDEGLPLMQIRDEGQIPNSQFLISNS